jgi:hypothetical protein
MYLLSENSDMLLEHMYMFIVQKYILLPPTHITLR